MGAKINFSFFIMKKILHKCPGNPSFFFNFTRKILSRQYWQKKHPATCKKWLLHMIQILSMLQKTFMTNPLWRGCLMLKNSTKNHKSTHHTRKLLMEYRKCLSRLGCRRISNSYRQCHREVSFQDNRKQPHQPHCLEGKKPS